MGLIEQIRVGLMVGASDPAAELIELREPEFVGVVDDDRVDVWNVDAVFDDRGRDQHVDLSFDEGLHDRLDLRFLHLAVADSDPRARQPAAPARS